MSLISNLLARLFPDPLPVLKAMPAHVANLNLDMALVLFQMESFREQKSPAVNNATWIRPSGDK